MSVRLLAVSVVAAALTVSPLVVQAAPPGAGRVPVSSQAVSPPVAAAPGADRAPVGGLERPHLGPAAGAVTGGQLTAERVTDEITIVRDGFGVPHVFAGTRGAVSFGAGYALAQDRLWQMHVLRLMAKGQLSELLGPVAINMDRTVRFFTYTAQERARRLATYPEDIQAALVAFAEGVNAWIGEAERNPARLPFEFAKFGVAPIPRWTVDDSVALQDALVLAFGAGGGNELAHAGLLARLIERFGEQDGLAAFGDLVRTTDPDDPQTIPAGFDWESSPTFARQEQAQARRALTPDARISLHAAAGEKAAVAAPADGPARPGAPVRLGEPTGAGAAAAPQGALAQLGLVPDVQAALADTAWLRAGLASIAAVFNFGSNAQIVGPQLSETANTLQTAGPEVGYTVPQMLVEIGLHGGGWNSTGMTFAGVGPAVLIGRGPGYAWTTTTGASDLTDTFVVRLAPEDPRSYIFHGVVEPMECRTETFAIRGAPFETREVCRTRHGPVMSFDEANGVAYALRYAWFNREGQTVEGFFRFNEAASLEDFATAASSLSSNHNMFYTDDQGNYGFWHSGNHPVRVEGVDLRLPQDGSGASEWRGILPIEQVPRAVNFERGWLVNWNNSPAVGWERERAHSARDNADSITKRFAGERIADPFGGLVNPDPLWDFEDLSANLRYGAFKDHAHGWYKPAFPLPADLETDLARQALGVLHAWDGFRADRNGDGYYDSAGPTVLSRWVVELREEVFRAHLGADIAWARPDTEVWHAVSPESTLEFGFDWLEGRTRAEVAAAAFERAVARLARQFDNAEPANWRSPARTQRYQRLNADLAGDLARTQACAAADGSGLGCPDRLDRRYDSGMPGDIPEHIRMARGTYNHIVQYLDPPAGGATLGLAASKAGSVLPPGQSGFVNLAGQEDRHFQDQLPLYVEWRYKPMPLSRAELKAGSVETLTRRR